MTLPRAGQGGLVDLKPNTYNALAESADAVNRLTQLSLGQSPQAVRPPGTIIGTYVASEDFAVGDVVGLDVPSNVAPSPLPDFLQNNVLKATSTLDQADHRMGRWGVVMSPMPAAIGACDVQVWGIASVQLFVTDESAEYCDIDSSDRLAALHYGWARILWKESGAGLKWAKIMMGDMSIAVHGILLAGSTAAGPADLTIEVARTQTTETVVVWNDILRTSIAAGSRATAVWHAYERRWQLIRSGTVDVCEGLRQLLVSQLPAPTCDKDYLLVMAGNGAAEDPLNPGCFDCTFEEVVDPCVCPEE